MTHFDTADDFETFVIELYEKYAQAVEQTTAYDVAIDAIASVNADAEHYTDRVGDGACPVSVLEFSQSPVTAGAAQSVDRLAAHALENDLKLLSIADDPTEYPPTLSVDVEMLDRQSMLYVPTTGDYLRVATDELLPGDVDAGETFHLRAEYEDGAVHPTGTADAAGSDTTDETALLFTPEDVLRDLPDGWEPFDGLPDYSAELEHAEEPFALSVTVESDGGFEIALHHPDANGIGHSGFRVENYVAGGTGTGLEDARNAVEALVTNRDILLENRVAEQDSAQ